MSETTGSTSTSPTFGQVFEDLLESLWAPGTVGARARGRAVGKYIIILTVITAIITVATKGLIQPWLDGTMALQMQAAAAKGQPMPEGAADATAKIGGVMYLVMGVLMVPMAALFSGAFLWVAGKIVKAPLLFGQAALVAMFGFVPRVVSFIVSGVEGALMDSSTAVSLYDLSFGPARFMDAKTVSPAVMALVGGLDLFSMWQLVIYAAAVATVARVQRSTGIMAAIVAWAISAVLSLLPAVLFG
jgi:hypothetical protein